MAGLSLPDRVRRSDLRRKLGAAPWHQKEPMRWFGYLIRMPVGHLPLEVLQVI